MSDVPDDAGSERSRRSTHWSQPCSNLLTNANNTQRSLSDDILLAAAVATSFMHTFKPNFSQGVFQLSWDELVNSHSTNFNFAFIKKVDVESSSQLSFDEQLVEAYEVMQRLAVGIEQVTLDQALYRGQFLQEFRKIESHIVQILCWLHYAMIHRSITPSSAITKEIMEEQYRDVDGESSRNMRDAVIIREYDAALLYLRDVFTAAMNTPEPSGAP